MKKKKLKHEYRLQFVLSILICIFAAIFVSRVYVRVDLTKQKTYTLSPISLNILENLEGVAEITWFKSSGVEVHIPSLQYVKDFLTEYAAKGNCIFTVKDTGSVSQTALEKLGLAPQQIERTDKNSVMLENLYSGLMLEYLGETRLIPFLADTTRLEARLARFFTEIKQDVSGGKNNRTVFLLAPPDSLNGHYRYIIPWLQYEGFIPQVLSLPLPNLDPQVPLLVLGSGYLHEDDSMQLELFLEKKGNAVFFVSGNTVAAMDDWSAQAKKQDPLIELLVRHGISINASLIIDILNFRMTLPSANGMQYEKINYPFWPTVFLSAENSSLIFAGLPQLQLFWPSSVDVQNSDDTLQVLAHTSKNSITLAEPYDTNPFGKQLSLIANADNKRQVPFATASTKKGRLIVVADENMVSTAIEYTNSDYNLDFMINCLDWICGKEQILQLKNKQAIIPPFKNFETADKAAGIFSQARVINFLIIPLCILLAAISVQIVYRRKQ